jgi:integrase
MIVRRIGRLTALQVKNARKPGYLADGGGLYLRVSDAGSRSWVFFFTRAGKRREMGLGPYPDMTLEQAREAALEKRRVVKAGDDPIEARRAVERDKLAQAAKAMTFAQAAEACVEAKRAGWRNAKHANQWVSTLDTYALPVLGKLDVAVVDTALMLKVLEPMWTVKSETASRLRGRIEAVLDWAATRGHRKGENPARWHGHLENLLAKPSAVAKVRHQPALQHTQVGDFMRALRQVDGIAARALEFVVLTAVRSGEARLAKWKEIDLEAGVWVVPASRMKAGKEHRVPLSPRAVALLEALPRLKGVEFVFPGRRVDAALSDMTLTAVIRRMNAGSAEPSWVDREGREVVPHGFRSTFRDWAAERTAFPREVAEQALAHTLSDAVEAAYRRSDLFDKRRALMDAWAAYCDAPEVKGRAVVGIGRRGR